MKNPNSTSKPTKYLSQTEELKSLQATIKDLQAKRINALRLYQDEKNRCQAQTEKVAELSAKLSSAEFSQSNSQSNDLVQSIPESSHIANGYPTSSTNHNTDTTPSRIDKLKAEVRTIGLAPFSCYPSLTWHCLAMKDLIEQPTEVFAVLHPISEYEQNQLHDHQTSSTTENILISSNSKSFHTTKGNDSTVDSTKDDGYNDVRIISELKTQLDETNDACKNLAQIVREQEETIERLSYKRPA